MNEMKIPVFCLAFGRNADYTFAKKVTAQNNGFARKIYEDSDADLQITGFYNEISSVTLQNVTFEYLSPAVDKSLITETSFKNYFEGTELIVAGKLGSMIRPSDTDFQSGMWGTVLGITDKGIDDYVIRPENIITNEENEFALITQKLWAYLTIKKLLRQKDASTDVATGRHLKERIIELSLKYNFVTPLTSMVVILPEELKSKPVEWREEEKSVQRSYNLPANLIHYRSPISGSRSYGPSGNSGLSPWPPSFVFSAPLLLPRLPHGRTSKVRKTTTTATSTTTTTAATSALSTTNNATTTATSTTTTTATNNTSTAPAATTTATSTTTIDTPTATSTTTYATTIATSTTTNATATVTSMTSTATPTAVSTTTTATSTTTTTATNDTSTTTAATTPATSTTPSATTTATSTTTTAIPTATSTTTTAIPTTTITGHRNGNSWKNKGTPDFLVNFKGLSMPLCFKLPRLRSNRTYVALEDQETRVSFTFWGEQYTSNRHITYLDTLEVTTWNDTLHVSEVSNAGILLNRTFRGLQDNASVYDFNIPNGPTVSIAPIIFTSSGRVRGLQLMFDFTRSVNHNLRGQFADFVGIRAQRKHSRQFGNLRKKVIKLKDSRAGHGRNRYKLKTENGC